MSNDCFLTKMPQIQQSERGSLCTLPFVPQVFNRTEIWALTGPFQNMEAICHYHAERRNIFFIISCLTEAYRCCAKIDLDLSMVLYFLTRALVPTKEKQLHSMTHHHGYCVHWVICCLVFTKNIASRMILLVATKYRIKTSEMIFYYYFF